MGRKSNQSSRNVLALPEQTLWPLLQESESETLLLMELKKALKLAKTQQPQLKWAEIKKMKKEGRTKKVEQFFENLSPKELEFHQKAKHLKKSLAIGVNEVSRSLEKQELACCLLHGQAKPKMINTHIVQLAKCRMIPVLILIDLKQSLKESIGFSSLALGFLKEVMVNENHEFHQLCSLIINLYEDLFGDSDQTTAVESKAILKAEVSVRSEKSNENNYFSDMIIDGTSLHLHRKSTSYRVFHPPNEDSSSDKEAQIHDGEDSVIKEVPPNVESEIPNKKAKYFIEPNILKVQSNPNKFRKKKSKKKT